MLNFGLDKLWIPAALWALDRFGTDDENYEDERQQLLDVQGGMAQSALESQQRRIELQDRYMAPALEAVYSRVTDKLGEERPMLWGRGIFEPKFADSAALPSTLLDDEILGGEVGEVVDPIAPMDEALTAVEAGLTDHPLDSAVGSYPGSKVKSSYVPPIDSAVGSGRSTPRSILEGTVPIYPGGLTSWLTSTMDSAVSGFNPFDSDNESEEVKEQLRQYLAAVTDAMASYADSADFDRSHLQEWSEDIFNRLTQSFGDLSLEDAPSATTLMRAAYQAAIELANRIDVDIDLRELKPTNVLHGMASRALDFTGNLLSQLGSFTVPDPEGAVELIKDLPGDAAQNLVDLYTNVASQELVYDYLLKSGVSPEELGPRPHPQEEIGETGELTLDADYDRYALETGEPYGSRWEGQPDDISTEIRGDEFVEFEGAESGVGFDALGFIASNVADHGFNLLNWNWPWSSDKKYQPESYFDAVAYDILKDERHVYVGDADTENLTEEERQKVYEDAYSKGEGNIFVTWTQDNNPGMSREEALQRVLEYHWNTPKARHFEKYRGPDWESAPPVTEDRHSRLPIGTALPPWWGHPDYESKQAPDSIEDQELQNQKAQVAWAARRGRGRDKSPQPTRREEQEDDSTTDNRPTVSWWEDTRQG